MKRFVCCALLIAEFVVPTLAQGISDADILKAIGRGKTSTTKQLWNEIKKNQQFRINRAGPVDPVGKKISFLSDADRIALEAAEAKRQLRDITLEEVKLNLPLGITEVLLEANSNDLYAGSLPKWGPDRGVHLVLKVNGTVIQPQQKRGGPSDSVSLLPQQHGVISAQGNIITYTPLYRSALYERSSQRAWFAFPALSPDVKTITVIAISGDGKRKEKEIENPFRN